MNRPNCLHVFAVLALAAPAAWGAGPVTFGVIGDYGSGTAAETDVANLVKSWNPDFIITAGDNNYLLGGADTIDTNIGRDYHEYIYNYQGAYGAGSPTRRFFPVPGNHDYFTANAQPYYDFFDLPGNERYYMFSQGPADFFMLDSNLEEPDGAEIGSKQADWLREAMAASPARWKVVTLHHAPYSSGAWHGDSTWMQWPFAPWGASVVLAGHEHTYERLSVDGIPCFVNGVGGFSLYPFDATPLPESQLRYNDNYGAMKVTAADDSMHFEFWTRTPTLRDDFTVAPPMSRWSGASGRWDDAAQWTTAAMPGDGADVTLAGADGAPRTIDYSAGQGAAIRLARLAIDATGGGAMLLRQSQDVLQVRSMVVGGESQAGRFRKTGGTLDADTIYNAGTFEHLGGTLHLANAFYNAAGTAELGGSLQLDPGAWIIAAGGMLRITSDAGAVSRPALKVRNAAAVELDGTQHLDSLEMTGGWAFINGNGMVVTNALSIDAGAQLDIGLGCVILFYTGAPPAVAIGQLVRTDLLTANSAGAGRTVAVVDNALLHQTDWRGEPLFSPNGDYCQLLAISALRGDVNLDGVVDATDFANIVAHQGSSGTWFEGDVNHDGLVTPDDYAVVAAYIGNGGAMHFGPALDGAPLAPADTGQEQSAATVAVPEPVASSWLVALSVTLLRRDRMRRPRTSRPGQRNARTASGCT
ncbi:MAG: metallophosphoesterase [Tepidisphaerales bacterium]